MDTTALDNVIFDGFASTSERRYIYLSNLKTRVSRWSSNAVRYFDLPGEYTTNSKQIWESLMHPQDLDRYRRDMQSILEGNAEQTAQNFRVRNRDGEYVVVTCTGQVFRDSLNQVDLLFCTLENHGIADNIDPVTNLYNVTEFWKHLDGHAQAKQDVTALVVGINNFNSINNTYGYTSGNRVLKLFADNLISIFGKVEKVYRMDGSKFGLCTVGLSEEEVKDLYENIRIMAKNKVIVDGIHVTLAVCGGTIHYNNPYDRETLRAGLMFAIRVSKRERQGELVGVDEDRLQEIEKYVGVMNAVRSSVQRDCEHFYMCYQPIMDAEDEKVIGAEALLRWRNDEFGEVPPGVFIPRLENDVCFFELGNWILETALTEAQSFVEINPEFLLNVNLAYPQIANAKFADSLVEILKKTNYPVKNLCLELTERCRFLDREYLKGLVGFIRSLGIQVALDDFGTGFSSLNLLSSLDVNTIKIDREFVTDIKENIANQAIVSAVTDCADALAVKVCVEGLENREMIDFMKKFKVQCYQGYYYSKPIPQDEFVNRFCNC